MRRTAAAALAASMAVGAAAGCSGGSGLDQASPSAFRHGACRQAAKPILDVGDRIHAVAQGDVSPKKAEKPLTNDQKKLIKITKGADGATQHHLQDLVTAIGFYRIGVDTKLFKKDERTGVAKAQRALVRFCAPKS
jgi:hypothetical protein